MDKPVIEVRGLSKQYKINEKQKGSTSSTLWRGIKQLFRGKKGRGDEETTSLQTLWAIDDITFDVHRGERLGIIGRNGAGKTTLLKILSRLAYPTKGEAIIRGRINSLFGVGTGIRPELTGRENIYADASLFGLSKSEIADREEDIIAFSGVRKFIDTKLKFYSKGMKQRLAFSITAHLDPDILLLDEVLGGGDMQFQQKCLQRADQLTTGGRTILLVSHNTSSVLKLCSKVMWLENGRIEFFGNVVEGIERYQGAMTAEMNEVRLDDRTDRRGTGHAQVTKIGLYDEAMRPVEAATSGRDLVIVLHYKCDLARLPENQNQLACCLYIENSRTERLFGMPNYILKPDQPAFVASEGKIIYRIKKIPLSPDHYLLTFTLTLGEQTADKLRQSRGLVVLEGDFYGTGKSPHRQAGSFLVDFEVEHEALKHVSS